jgi:hypothetical protein
MRIRTANDFGLVRLSGALVIVLVLVMSGSAAFGQQSGEVKNKKVGAATSKIIKEEPPMRIMTDNSEPGGSNPGGGFQGGVGGGDVPAPPYFSSPLYFILPSPPGSPSAAGTPGGTFIEPEQCYKDQCPCTVETAQPTVSGTFGDWEAQQCDPTKGFELVTTKIFVGWRYLYQANPPSPGQVCSQGAVISNLPWVYATRRYFRFVNCHQVQKDDDTYRKERWDNTTPGASNVPIPCGKGFGTGVCE